MKTIQLKFKTLILLLLVGFAFSSCSSDDDGNTPDPEPENQAPDSFTLNQVTDGADLQPQLSWETATDPEGDDVSYQVYLDTQDPPQITIANNLGISSFNLENALEPETTYYWRVMAKDTEGNTTESAIASFTTRDKTHAEAIIGKWFFDSAEGQPPLTECIKNGFILFNNDLTGQMKSYQEEEDNNGDCILSSNDTFTYTIIGDQIEVNNSPIWEIQSLTETELILQIGGSILILKKE